MIQTVARSGSQSREEKVERALSRECLLSRVHLTCVLAERMLRRLNFEQL